MGTRRCLAVFVLSSCLMAVLACGGSKPALDQSQPTPPEPVAEAGGVPAKNPELGRKRLRAGIDLLVAGDAARARQEFLGSAEADPEALDARRLLDLMDQGERGRSREQMIRGISLLNEGAPERARIELAAALCSNPENRLASQLLAQIDADAVALLGEVSFPYTVQPGESLSRIAKRFLGDTYKFYLLARYNGIERPDRLQAGEEIRVPGAPPGQPIEPAQPATDRRPPSVVASLPAGSYAGPVTVTLSAEDAEDPEPLITYTTDGSIPTPEEGVPYREPIRIDKDTGLRFMATDRSGNASAVVVVAYRISQVSEPLPEQVTGGVDNLYREGLDAQNRGKLEEARRSYLHVLALEPGHAEAKERLAAVEKSLVDTWYRDAHGAMRRQLPHQTVEFCNKVLSIDPNHANAKILKMQASDLIANLVEVDLAEARAAFERGDWGEVLRHCNNVLGLDPGQEAALDLCARAQQHRAAGTR